MTTPFDPFLDPPVAIVKDNFVILNAMHQKNEFGETCRCYLEFRFAYASTVPDLLESASGAAGNWRTSACAALQDGEQQIQVWPR